MRSELLLNRLSNLFSLANVGVLLIAFMLCARLAIYAGKAKSPDETLHIVAVRHYVDNILPPVLESKDGKQRARSVYGNSYNDYLDIVYFYSGRLVSLTEKIKSVDDNTVYIRFTNLALLALLIALICFYRDCWWLFIPLATPQVWYLFGYFNGDAFPHGISLVFILLFADCLKRIYTVKPFSRTVLILLGAVLGLLTISKLSYLSFIIATILVWTIFLFYSRSKEGFRSYLSGTLTVLLIAATIFGVRYGAEIYINGLDRTKKLATIREKRAAYAFKRSTPLEESYVGLWLNKKEDSFSNLFTKWGWHELSWCSMVGLYGHMNIFSSQSYYRAVRIFHIVALFLFLAAVLINSNKLIVATALSLLLGVIGTVAASLYRTWFYDFQAQGRYLLPILCLFALQFAVVQFVSNNTRWKSQLALVMNAVVFCLLILGVHSFRSGVAAILG